jgi:hypothetical protein
MLFMTSLFIFYPSWQCLPIKSKSIKEIAVALRPHTPGVLPFVEKKVPKETFPSKISGRLVQSASGKIIQTRFSQTRIIF